MNEREGPSLNRKETANERERTRWRVRERVEEFGGGRERGESRETRRSAQRVASIPPPAFPATAHTVAAAPPPWLARVHMRDCARVSRDHLAAFPRRRRILQSVVNF